MNTLKLFNAVIAKPSNEKPYISDEGYIITPNALWAKDRIIAFFKAEKLNGNDLNKTFHKSWNKIKNSSRYELYVEQIEHYMSTYGSDFNDEIYIPEEILNIPNVKLNYKVINAYSADIMKQKCLTLLKSGMALKEDTVDELIILLVDELGYTFTGNENIRNKEAIVKLAEYYNIYPENAVEFFRYIIYRATDTTLLIKNDALIALIKESSYNPTQAFKQFGLEKLAEIFNRFKPLFLAFKNKASKTINKISKLSKTYHKPLVSNPLNDVTNAFLTEKDVHWLDNATPFALFKALSACYTRKQGQDAFLYRIRNGKSWVKSDAISAASRNNMLFNLLKRNKAGKHKKVIIENTVFKENYQFLLSYLKQRFDKPTGIAFIDSTSLKVCHNMRIPRHRVFAGKAKRGKGTMG